MPHSSKLMNKYREASRGYVTINSSHITCPYENKTKTKTDILIIVASKRVRMRVRVRTDMHGKGTSWQHAGLYPP